MVRRSGAKPGDRVMVSGTIGDAAPDPHTTAGKLADLERRRHEAVHAGGDLALDQGGERLFVDRAIAKRRDQRWKDAMESGFAHEGPQNAVNLGD